MAVVKGTGWQTPTHKRLRRAGKTLAKAAAKTRQATTETLCKKCDPPAWVRRGDVENHRANYHRPGGYQYELRKQRAEAAKDAEKATKAAAKTVKAQPARPPERPRNQSKTSSSTKGSPVAQGGTNGSTWTSPVGRKPQGSAGGDGGPSTLTTTEAIAQLMWTWARQVPPSIPAGKADAAAAAEMWRQIADALRARARLEAEQNKIPPDCLEPYTEAATRVSQVGDQHMEVVKRVTTKYGEVARTLADPRTPDADYLKGGA